jgi:UDP-glucose:(heptosyl)LPS alpha-1,3-glucosyltransferase
MKVALVNYTWSPTAGGVERVVSNLARGLAARGHEVHVVCARGRQGSAPAGVTILRVPVTTWYSPLRYASFARNSAALLEQEPFDIVHGFGRTWRQDICRVGGGSHWEYLRHTDPKMRFALGRLLRRLNPRDRIILDLERRCFAPGAYRKVVCVSHRIRDEIRRLFGVPETALAVIHNGVNLEQFSTRGREEARHRTRERFGLRPDDRVALFAGSGFERKGLRYAIEAMALVPEPERFRLLVIGRGNAAPYRRLARRLRLRETVMFLGERSTMQDYYAAADVLVLPTLYDPFPNVCLEAMASGIPVITTRVTGVAEIVEPGADSFVVEDGTRVMDLAGCLRQLADPARRVSMGRAARACAERHSLEDHIERTLAVYAEVLDMKRRNPA